MAKIRIEIEQKISDRLAYEILKRLVEKGAGKQKEVEEVLKELMGREKKK